MYRVLNISMTGIFLAISFLLSSCGELYSANKHTILVSAQAKEWFVDLTESEEFTMLDEHVQPEVFELEYERTHFNGARYSSGIFDTEEYEFEVIEQEFLSDKGSDFSIDIETREPPEGPLLVVEVNNLRYKYDLSYDKIIQISTMYGYKFMHFREGTYRSWDAMDAIYSTASYHDTLMFNDTEYTGVMEFHLLDFEDQWEDSTITEIIIAKKVGLLKYAMSNGTVMSRR